jgi:hypothetical protein
MAFLHCDRRESLSEVDPGALQAWYCMHSRSWAMSDKRLVFDWLANDVLHVRIDVRIPTSALTSPRYCGLEIRFKTSLRVQKEDAFFFTLFQTDSCSLEGALESWREEWGCRTISRTFCVRQF